MEKRVVDWVIGLMSGTSLDGVDAALIKTDGAQVTEFGPGLTLPYDAAFRQALKSTLGGQGPVAEVERELTQRHAQAVKDLLEKAGLAASEVSLIGFHGQTILHAPKDHRTWQIGDGALLAGLTGIAVVNDFRSADVAAGGEGAPLAPILHQVLAQKLEKPLVVLNLGGVANVTWIGPGNGELLAFDTGPANALLDDWAQRHVGEPIDRDGKLASAGKVNQGLLATWLQDPYFHAPPPKSLDRDHFKACWPEGLSPQDGAATLLAFTVESVRLAGAHFPTPPKRWLVTGGGRRNPQIMHALAKALAVPVDPVEAVGWDGDLLEAQAFALMAARSRRGLPLSFPGTTRVPRPLTGGRYHAV